MDRCKVFCQTFKAQRECNHCCVAPSSYPDHPHFDLYAGLEYLRRLGYRVILGETLKNTHLNGLTSGSPEERAAEINWAFRDDSVDAIICARGGVGSLRLLDLLD